jgi:competence protein ComEC
VLSRGRRALSARRPLPWAWWLPALAVGLLLGQSICEWAGVSVAVLVAAAALAAPSMFALQRAAATLLVLATCAASVGVLQIAWQSAARERRAASIAPTPELLRGRIRSVKSTSGRGDASWVAIDLVSTEPSASLARGELVRLTVWQTTRVWQVGELVSVRAVLRPPRGFCNEGEDGYARAHWRSGVVALAAVPSDRSVTVEPARAFWTDPYAVLAAARAAVTHALDAAVPGADERAVLRALVIGDQTAIRSELRHAYARTGTAHVLSVSGLHIALVATAAYAALHALLVRWPRLALRVLVARVAACAALLPATFYALLSGGAVATLRSLVMGALALGAIVLQRRAAVWTALAAAALLLCAADPGVAADPSFQLSFASVAALVVAGRWFVVWRERAAGPWLDPAHRRGRALSLLLGAVVASAAASLATAPITAFQFGSVALIGVLANLIVVPLIGWLVLLLVLAGAALLPISTVAASVLLWLAGGALRPGNQLVEWLAAWRWSALDVALASPLQVVALLALLCGLASPAGRGRRGSLAVAGLLGMLIAAQAAARRIEPRLAVRFLDVGQGDATIVELAASGRALVVDGGGLGGSFDTGERVVVPALRRAGIASVSALALSHPERDHYGGLAAVVRALPVSAFWSNGRDSSSASYRALLELLAAYGVDRLDLAAGDRPLVAGADGAVRVLHPPRSSAGSRGNDASLVLLVEYGASRLLLTGDLEASAESALLRRGDQPSATIVKVPHHGSRTSSTRALLAAARPGVAVAMLGANNRFGFPDRDVRARYQSLGAAWRQTDRDGAVAITSDGQLERVATCRP